MKALPRIRRHWHSRVFVLLIAGWPALPSAADTKSDPEGSRATTESKETVRLIQAELPSWKLWQGADRKTELKLEPKPLLRWTNPGTARVYGDLYVWTARGRPEAALSLFKGWDPGWGFTAEMQSLSLTGLVAEREGKVLWEPDKPGITLSDVPGAGAPGDTATKRLRQMRSLVGEFSTVMIDYRNNRKGERQTLRLLPQPLYRYQSTAPEVIDGAMFAFVLGTDSEVLLLLEARSAGDRTSWQYAFARMNNDELIGLHNEREVWRVGRAHYEDGPREPYKWIGIPEPPAR